MFKPLGNIAFRIGGVDFRNASLPRTGATPGSRPIISNSKSSAIESSKVFTSPFSRPFRNASARSFCCSRFMLNLLNEKPASAHCTHATAGHPVVCRLLFARTDHEHRARRAAHQLLGRPAEQHMLDAAASMRRHHDQVDALLFGVVSKLLNRMTDDGERDDFVRIAEVVLLDACEFFLR